MKTVELNDSEAEPQLSMNSMMDIVFLLLIFFILQPFKAPEMRIINELPKDLGQSTAQFSAPISNISINITPRVGFRDQANFQVDNRQVPHTLDLRAMVLNISEALRNSSEKDPNIPVIIKTSNSVKFRWVIAALDACMAEGMNNVKFAGP